MNLDEAQRKAVADWIAQGLKLADIQNRLVSEFGLRLTYMEVRMLVDHPRSAEYARGAKANSAMRRVNSFR